MKDKDKPSSFLPAILVTIFIFAALLAGLTILMYLSYFSGEIQQSHTRWGEFGDFFGGTLNPLFGFLGLLALLLTLLIQSRELSISSRELKNSATALREQSESLKIQNFERTFFEMVRLLGAIVNDLDLGDSTKGRDCFKVFYKRRLGRKYTISKNNLSEKNTHIEICKKSYDSFFLENEHEVAHYFRTLYRIFKYIKEEAPKGKANMYSGIVRAQLSSYESSLLFYNSLHDVGKRFVPLIEDYSLLENMRISDLFDPSNHIPLYNKKAYGDKNVSEYMV